MASVINITAVVQNRTAAELDAMLPSNASLQKLTDAAATILKRAVHAQQVERADVAVGSSVSTDLVRASKAGTFSGTGTDGDTITVGGEVFTLKDTPGDPLHVQIGSAAEETAAAFVAAVNSLSSFCYASDNGSGVITLYAQVTGKIGNLITISESGTGFSFAGAATALSGGLGTFGQPEVRTYPTYL